MSAFTIYVIILCILLYIVYYSVTQLKKYDSLDKLPGPSSLELLRIVSGNYSKYDKYQYLISLTKSYGPVLKLWIKPFSPVVVVTDVEVMGRILLSKDHVGKSKAYEFFTPLVGEGLGITNKDTMCDISVVFFFMWRLVDRWKRDRKVCNTVFQPSNIIEFLPLLKKHMDKLLHKLEDHTNKAVNTQPLVHLYTLDVAFEFTAKHDFNFQDNINDEYLKARVNYFNTVSERLYSICLQNDILFKFSKHFKLRNKAASVLRGFIYDTIRSERNRKKGTNSEGSRLHIIDVFENSDINSLQDQIHTFILAGQDTTAEALCFALYALSRHPEVQQRVFQETRLLVGEDREVTNKALNEMTYLEAVINEVLRLFPVIPMIQRKVSSAIEINDVHYPKGTLFTFLLNNVHKSSSYFENPDRFNPDRFLPENAHLLIKHSFAPFSIGPRNCIGKLFAMLLLKYTMVRIIQQYKILPVENHSLKVFGEMVAKSVTGTPVILEKRCS